MPKAGTKRRASEAFPYSKAKKRSTVGGWKPPSASLPVMAMLPPAPEKRSSVKRGASSASGRGGPPAGPAKEGPPSLRRASTLPVDDEAGDKEVPRRISSKKSIPAKPSLSRKESSVVSEHGLVTSLEKLPSGSIVGESFTDASVRKCPSLSRSLSKKASAKKSDSVGSVSSKGRPEITDVAQAVEELQSSSDASAAPDAGAEADPSGAADAALPPGGLVEVAISFDTTGSMYGCLVEVRAKIQDLIQRLQADIPGIRTAIIAHGDYCDAAKYVIKWIDFGASLPETIDFVNKAESTYGGDGPECYELVLNRAREALSWTPGSQRVLVVIGDDEPHPVGYRYGGKKYDIDWRKESRALRDMGVTVYGVQAGNDSGCVKFMNELAKITGGKRLTLEHFANIFDILMMICYREGNPDMMPVYEDEVRGRGGMAKDMADLLVAFGADESDDGMPVKKTAKRAPAKVKKPSLPTKGKKALKASPAKGKTTKAKKTPKAASVLKKGKKAAGKVAKKAVSKKSLGKKPSPKKKKPKMLLRECIPDNKMEEGPLKKLKWSPWQLGITQSPPAGRNRKRWMKCDHYSGYRAREIFGKDSRAAAIYEVAVQLPKGRKKYTMYFRRTIGYHTRGMWDKYLLKCIRPEVERVASLGCNIFIRRGVVTSAKDKLAKVQEINTYIRKNIDYAWRKYLYGKRKHRKVVRNKVLLSSDKI